MNESSRGVEGGTAPFPATEGGGGDPPISGGFSPPPHLKEEFPSPPASAQGQAADLPTLATFEQDELGNPPISAENYVMACRETTSF